MSKRISGWDKTILEASIPTLDESEQKHKPDKVYSYIAPSGRSGGYDSSSQLVVVDMIRGELENQWIIIGMDSYSNDMKDGGGDIDTFVNYLKNHYTSIRKNPLYEDVPILLIFETNSGWIYTRFIYEALKESVTNITPYKTCDNIGITITARIKQDGLDKLHMMLLGKHLWLTKNPIGSITKEKFISDMCIMGDFYDATIHLIASAL